jgi:putative PIN family toxin of toxin-antitoxin system
MLTIVFDTNILFSGFGWRGSPYHCLQLARKGKVTSITCPEIMKELDDKLQLKMKISPIDALRATTEILLFSKLVTISNKLKVVIDDPDDDKILECAVIGNADYIITGDHHLLSLVNYKDTAIVTSTDFLNLMLE